MHTIISKSGGFFKGNLPEIQGFCQMGFLNIGSAIKVGDSTGDLDDFKVASSGEVKGVSGGVEESFFGSAKGDKLGDLVGREGSVVSSIIAIAGMLSVKGGGNGVSDGG